jgi:hypothetical protein
MDKVISKHSIDNFQSYDWLDFDYLPDSDGYKLEINFSDSNDLVKKSIGIFLLLFGEFKNDILIGGFGVNSEWGSYCLDTWILENDTFDYDLSNKYEPTFSYLSMLKDNLIEPTYIGVCSCLNWEVFLQLTLHCVYQNVAPYGMIHYIRAHDIAFYFHHTGSIGLYYKSENLVLREIIQKVKINGLEITNSNNPKLIDFYQN